MAVRPVSALANIALELDGNPVAYLRSLQLPGYRLDPVVTAVGGGGEGRLSAIVGISPMQAMFELGQPSPLLDWALSLPRAKPQVNAGTALLLDANFRVQRRVAWTGGLPTELSLPELNATSKSPFLVGLTWQPETVAYPKAATEAAAKPAKARKAILCSNFRVTGLPFDGRFVRRVVLPAMRAKVAAETQGKSRIPVRRYAGIDLGEVLLEFGARSRDDVLAWVQKVVSDGRVDDSESLNVSVELLDPTLKTVLATITLSGCLLLAFDEDPVTSDADTVQSARLRFTVGQFDLKAAAQN